MFSACFKAYADLFRFILILIVTQIPIVVVFQVKHVIFLAEMQFFLHFLKYAEKFSFALD